ncbi:MAG TPA: hypothetical protein PK990_03660 [Salinivirgaceae bacterium]|nr:hypothetical protein [Salinivirgaceae bacterium]
MLNIAWAYYRFFETNPRYFAMLWVLENKFFVPNKEKEYSGNILRSFEKRKIALKIISQTFEKGIKDGSILTKENPEILLPVLWSQTLGILQVISRSSEYLAEELKIHHRDLFTMHLNIAKKILTEK